MSRKRTSALTAGPVIDVDEYADLVRKCKGGFRHAWYEYDSSDYKPEFGVYIGWKCERCETIALDKVDRYGSRIGGRRYIYVNSGVYKNVHIGSMTEWRQEFLASMRRQARQQRKELNS